MPLQERSFSLTEGARGGRFRENSHRFAGVHIHGCIDCLGGPCGPQPCITYKRKPRVGLISPARSAHLGFCMGPDE